MNSFTEKLRIHLTLSFKMLENIVANCPNNLWITEDENKSVCKRVLHVLESIDFWLDDFTVYCFNNLFVNVSAEMDIDNKSTLSKDQLIHYLGMIDSKIQNFFSRMNDELLVTASAKHPAVSYLDILLCQIRHIQINLGYCNEKFSSHGIPSPEWLGYNEE